MPAAPEPWRCGNSCVIVRVRVTPKSSLDTVTGVGLTADGPALLAKVRAAPVDGKANAAVERVVADFFGVPKSKVAVEQGAKSRIKSVVVTGLPDGLIRTIKQKIEGLTGSHR